MDKYGSLNNGLGKIAQAFAMKGFNNQRGVSDGMKQAADMDNSISQVFLNQANARKVNDKIDRRPQAEQQFLSGHTGMTLPKLQAALNYMQTGEGEAPAPETLKLLNDARQIIGLNKAATSDTNANQLMSGMKTGQDMSVVNKALAGNPNALALSKASPKYQQNSNGVVLDNYSGGQNYDPKLIQQVFASKNKGVNSTGGKLPTADIQLMNRLTVPKQQGGIGMDDQQAIEWLQSYKNNPVNAMMNMYSKISADNIFRPADQQLSPEQIMQMVQEMADQFGMQSQTQQPSMAEPSINADPAGIRGLIKQ